MQRLLIICISFALAFSADITITDDANGFTSFTIKSGDENAQNMKGIGVIDVDKKPSDNHTGAAHEPQSKLISKRFVFSSVLLATVLYFICCCCIMPWLGRCRREAPLAKYTDVELAARKRVTNDGQAQITPNPNDTTATSMVSSKTNSGLMAKKSKSEKKNKKKATSKNCGSKITYSKDSKSKSSVLTASSATASTRSEDGSRV